MKWLFAILILCSLQACTTQLSPYTSSVQQKTNLNSEALKQIQFYLQGEIILRRNLGNAETKIEGGNLKIVNGEKIEEIKIESGTPGVVIAQEENGILIVSFDQNGNTLKFGPNPGLGGRYTLMAKDWKGRIGVIEYGNQTYTSSPISHSSYLTINVKNMQTYSIDKKEASGRTLHP